VLFSNLAFDGRYASGRNGIGLCLSAKNIKYITVKGNCETGVFDPEGLNRACEDIRRLVAASPALLGKFGISNFGTLAFYDLIHSRRMMPTDNFRMTCFDAAPSMNAYVLMKKYQTTGSGCPSCYINCKRMTKDGIIMPEFDSMSHFSALLCNDDIATAIEADNICREMGMDPISAAGTLSCFSEISGKKLSSGEITELLTDIGKGRGVGIELGKGSFRYALSHGCPETSMTVKKQELPAYDPRGSYAMALAYATSTRGGCHLRAYPISYEILRKPVATDRFSFSGKARMVKVSEDLNAVVDSLSVCRFMFFAASLEEYARVYTAVTGMETSAHDLMKTGEAIYYNERMMNAKNGFTADDDDLPYRFFKEAGSSGGIVQIPPINRKDFLVTRSKYYAARGLDDKGMPLSDKPLKGSDS
jgi:aldehyde:ferredoxin oxidoreductase